MPIAAQRAAEAAPASPSPGDDSALPSETRRRQEKKGLGARKIRVGVRQPGPARRRRENCEDANTAKTKPGGCKVCAQHSLAADDR